ncbi:uncharacterized protein VICG_00776 [Vittaforma corneae ATCC 50505]|uniref:Uncharacterized protein n=1 Tax=Vittaforma corneae (strain ATCC 50505) TaxID=993615 RepID=L2GNS6_VITCO|nr:uncharacterized protein VICG_00776 [Vittaforma corneae ATCC 50505]ELA42135.1 hypothetical protein VICG_00776 [Vittaforma corneae ATCC 50505]
MVTDCAVQEFIQPYLNCIKKVFENESGQFMIVGMDKLAIEEIVNKLSSLSPYKVIKIDRQKDFNPDRKIFILKLENISSIEYQSLIYYYLELPANSKSFVCLVSTSSLALEFFEKRVRSRFRNKIFFIPYVNFELEVDNKENQFNIKIENKIAYSTIELKERQKLMKKYGLKEFDFNILFELFEPIHFVLLSIAFNQKLNVQKCNEQFKLAVIDTPELKRVPSSRVLFGVLDLVEAGIINLTGFPLVDFNEFKAFVHKNCPLYLKKLIITQSKLRK